MLVSWKLYWNLSDGEGRGEGGREQGGAALSKGSQLGAALERNVGAISQALPCISSPSLGFTLAIFKGL